MITDYAYCLNQDSCIHRRGCKRWIGNYSNDEAINESNSNRIGYIDDEECIRDEDLEDKYGNWIPTAYSMLDRFRYSDGTEMKK